MRKRLLEILRCPGCSNNSFSLEKEEIGPREIETGSVICQSCNISYPVREGIVDFLIDASKGVAREKDAMDNDEYIIDREGTRYRITPETIQRFRKQFLSLPDGDGSYFFKRGGSFQSIKENSSRFYSTFDELALTGKETILEIGACFSYASFKFAKRGCRVVAIDISNYLKVSNLFIEEAYFERIFSDMHDIPFMDNTFDIVFGSAVLHHSKDLIAAFTEIHRVLKPGGKLALINESARGVFEKVHPVFKDMDRKGFGDTSYSIPEWRHGAVRAGFKNIKIDFLSIVDDYISRHESRGSRETFKLKAAYFLRKNRWLEKVILFLLLLPRYFFRPKSWRLLCSK